jgi:LDH2 family malate/lactate/ureidoglycolate dehydrogenase
MEARFCTNPMAYGIPTLTDPIILDMTTSAMAFYGLIEAKTAGKTVPRDAGYNENGAETTDPAEIMSGALKTFGGHRGSGLATVVQILAGALVRADSFDDDSENSGNLVMAINPEIFLSTEEFKKSVSEMVKKIKSAKKLEGVNEIFVPGERGNRFRNATESTGEIEIEDKLWSGLKEVVSR